MAVATAMRDCVHTCDIGKGRARLLVVSQRLVVFLACGGMGFVTGRSCVQFLKMLGFVLCLGETMNCLQHVRSEWCGKSNTQLDSLSSCVQMYYTCAVQHCPPPGVQKLSGEACHIVQTRSGNHPNLWVQGTFTAVHSYTWMQSVLSKDVCCSDRKWAAQSVCADEPVGGCTEHDVLSTPHRASWPVYKVPQSVLAWNSDGIRLYSTSVLDEWFAW